MTTAAVGDQVRQQSWPLSTNDCSSSPTCSTNALHDGSDASAVFAEFVLLLKMNAANEEIGLFVHARSSTPLGDKIDVLCREHDDLHRWLADGPTGRHVPEALRLLVTHIDDEEYDLFPHIFHALDTEQWDEIELAHRAIEAVWRNDPPPPTTTSRDDLKRDADV